MSRCATTSEPGWACGPTLPHPTHVRLIRKAIFECHKWHTHTEDRPVLCPFPLLLERDVWNHLARTAEELTGETLAAEREMLGRPDLHRRLGLPPPILKSLRGVAQGTPTRGTVRVMRFDFHWTDEGWRITEANVDVAGGWIEGSGVAALMAAECAPWTAPGDPAGALCAAIHESLPAGGTVGLMHLTHYSEDRQIMLYLQARLESRGISTCLLSPFQVRWRDAYAEAATEWYQGRLESLVRFFPTEWLPHLPKECGLDFFFAGGRSEMCHPAYAVLAQSKRFPLVWEDLRTRLTRWRELLPETRSPDRTGKRASDDWVLKPALGHEGKDVVLRGVSDEKTWRRVRRVASKFPKAWVAQRRFRMLPLETPEGPMYPCVGVFTINGRAAGAYGRIGVRPLIDDRSREIAVLVPAPRKSLS